MTQLLVSVRDADEALIAATHGADIVDVKEPRHGALGFATPDVIGQIVIALRNQTAQQPPLPISIAMGELADVATGCRTGARLPEEVWSEIRYAKVGCHDCPTERWLPRWEPWRAALPTHVLPIAVAYADHSAARSPLAEDVLERAIVGGAAGFLLDTFAKKSSHLFDFFSASRLDSLIHSAHSAQLTVAVAGSLRIPDLSRVLASNPDVVGVRGAVCEADRAAAICARRVQLLARAMDLVMTAKTVSPLIRHDGC